MPAALIIGSDRPEALEMSYSRAFNELGWQVERWNPAGALANVVRGGRMGRLLASFVNVEPWKRKANVELLQLAERLKPDLVLVVAAEGLRAGTLGQVRVLLPAAFVCAAYPDSPHSLDAERIACLSICDRVGVSSPAWVASFRKLLDTDVVYLPFAADTTLYRSTAADAPAPIQWDVGFVGTWRPERESLLESLAGFNSRVWGSPYWKSRTRPEGKVRGMWAGREAIGTEVADICARTAIMLNILDPITWPGPNMRSFELPVCGAFALSSRSEAILEIFQEGVSIECFASAAEAGDKVRYYLSQPDARLRIARAAHEIVVRGGHTYLDRARTIASWADRR